MKVALILFTAAISLGYLQAAPAAQQDQPLVVTQSRVLDVPIASVWNAIRSERAGDTHRHILSSNGTDYVVAEKFDHLPVIGTAECTYKEHEVPMSSVHYEMMTSDKLKAFDGTWELKSTSPTQTVVTLSARIDTGIDVPFSKRLTRDATMKSVTRRLTGIATAVDTRRVATLP